jgi:hypothetical protein
MNKLVLITSVRCMKLYKDRNEFLLYLPKDKLLFLDKYIYQNVEHLFLFDVHFILFQIQLILFLSFFFFFLSETSITIQLYLHRKEFYFM